MNTPPMDDRTLIERAAKAAGYAGKYDVEMACFVLADCDVLPRQWLPLDDDGDIARLEADCEIDVSWLSGHVHCSCSPHDGNAVFSACENYDDHDGDKQKARRYASTRAAASLAMGE